VAYDRSVLWKHKKETVVVTYIKINSQDTVWSCLEGTSFVGTVYRMIILKQCQVVKGYNYVILKCDRWLTKDIPYGATMEDCFAHPTIALVQNKWMYLNKKNCNMQKMDWNEILSGLSWKYLCTFANRGRCTMDCMWSFMGISFLYVTILTEKE